MRRSWLALILASALVAPAAAQDEHAGHPLPDGAHSETAVSGAPAERTSEAAAATNEAVDGRPPLLLRRGDGGFAITTAVPQAQAYFSNGMELAAAFDHDEAIAAMVEAVRLDPTCAMCRWATPTRWARISTTRRRWTSAPSLIGSREKPGASLRRPARRWRRR